jgi:16S rRNA (guanine(527)-N(7))-methyltransferase RsmG
MKSANDGLQRLLSESGIASESEDAHKLLGYLKLLEKWNERINLTASTEWSSLESLFREGIWVSRIYPPEAVSYLDIGSGAGFPAILLRILIPRVRLDMVESRAKKGVFLEMVIDALGLNGACVHSERLDVFLTRADRNRVWDCMGWKGVKLKTSELLRLRAHAHSRTQFWMFHGKELPVKEPEAVGRNFELLRIEKLPARKESRLSVFQSAVASESVSQ